MRNKFLKELKVLLVEDEERLANLFKSAIGDNFYKFYIANNGKDGLEKFYTLKPDLIITDITMPHLNGLDMAKEIRLRDKTIPIIILSAYSETDKFLDAIDIGVVKYFIKPYDPDELLDYISSIEDKFSDRTVVLEDEFSFNKSTNTLYKNGRYIALSKKENEFIQLLLQENLNGRLTVGDEMIKEKLWQEEEVSDERIRTFIKRLRAKTSKNLIVNVKGHGYQLPMP
ncbi:DNA-binding response regulator, OmpR family, contains REC and winged-helix (wHTH) domain [Epsilonproteobacteria bacterium SCGC AD-308-P11]|nr:DNA-binding response regulator, OmpR family, contains REC and winged-helix (wHTH) domain [Epsilonproteobacteria bacterium SCGC AD-308-P11]